MHCPWAINRIPFVLYAYAWLSRGSDYVHCIYLEETPEYYQFKFSPMADGYLGYLKDSRGIDYES